MSEQVRKQASKSLNYTKSYLYRSTSQVFPTCDQSLGGDITTQCHSLHLVLENELIVDRDVLGSSWLRKQMVLERKREESSDG